MSNLTNLQLSQAIHEAFSQNRFADILAFADDDIEVVSHSNGMSLKGKDQFQGFFMAFKTAFPDIVIEHTNTVTDENQVAIEFVGIGTNTGVFPTPMGEIPPSGRTVRLNVCEFHTWRNGKLIRLINYQDAMSLLSQIGALPPPAGL
ncbi:MAG: ester cyclase [Anaerolineae bacterium]|nr:ester cyclase [Anaerolineae bacterium]